MYFSYYVFRDFPHQYTPIFLIHFNVYKISLHGCTVIGFNFALFLAILVIVRYLGKRSCIELLDLLQTALCKYFFPFLNFLLIFQLQLTVSIILVSDVQHSVRHNSQSNFPLTPIGKYFCINILLVYL